MRKPPTGIRIADDATDTLLEQPSFTVLHNGQKRTLDLWLARGALRKPTTDQDMNTETPRNAQKGTQEAREGRGGTHGMGERAKGGRGPGKGMEA
jgi:hypothetical protein